jgi:FkbM family methyltransferase
MKYLKDRAKKIKQRLSRIIQCATPTEVEVEKNEQVFYIRYLGQGMIVFDVGANIGELSLLFSRFVGSSGKVHSFEASKSTFDKLTTVCQIAHRPQIILNHLAVSDQSKMLNLNVYSEEYSGLNSLADRPLENYGINLKPIHTEVVQGITLDDYCDKNKIDFIDLLKIDVEGAEYQVMLGAKSLFENKKIRCCVFEFGQTTFDMGNTPEQIESLLKHYGYRISNIVKGNPNFPGRANVLTAQFSLHIAKPN